MENKSSRSGIGFSGCLAILFIGLKLGHIIDWSWWWVFCPIWSPLAVGLALCSITGALYGASFLIGVSGELADRRAAAARMQIAMTKAKLK